MRLIVWFSAIALLLVQSLPANAAGDDCDVRMRNEPLVRQGDAAIESRGYGNSLTGQGRFDYSLYWFSPSRRASLMTVPRADAARRQPDYLQDSILSLADMLAARKQADALRSKGQTMLADNIVRRIDEVSKKLYGRATNAREQQCMSLAERLKENGWKLECRALFDMAEKSYRGAVEIYEKETGESIVTANALGDLARVCRSEHKTAEAGKLYARAVRIYDSNPSHADADTASLLENYVSLLDEQNEYSLGEQVTRRALAARKNAYRLSN
jgi:hypothetical protein